MLYHQTSLGLVKLHQQRARLCLGDSLEILDAGSVNAWSHLSFRWAAEKKVEEMAAVIEKQAFQIEALKRLYKAK